MSKAVFYSAAPAFGLDGNWPVDVRLVGMSRVIEACPGRTVLDLGSAEGLIARRLLEGGASAVHGYDLVSERTEAARRVCAGFPNAVFRVADLSDWEGFLRQEAGHLLPRYDIVLYLGLHHHLPEDKRLATLMGAASASAEFLAVRTPSAFYEHDHIDERYRHAGLMRVEEYVPDAGANLSPLRLYRRKSMPHDP